MAQGKPKRQTKGDRSYFERPEGNLYGRLRLVVSNRDVEQKVCLIEECAEFTRERVFQKKASKNLEIDKEIYKNLI